jgi:ABC-2 type transport system ATP-binding protein
MSGGQQAQIALTLALAKRPALLVLDEPVASLDPLARREFLQGLMEAVAGEGLTVVLSSHIVAELERVCDHLVILASGGVQLEGPIEEILASHRLLTGPRRDAPAVARIETVVQATHTERQTTLLVRTDRPIADPSWQVAEVGLEEVVLAYLGLQAGYGMPAQGRLELAS